MSFPTNAIAAPGAELADIESRLASLEREPLRLALAPVLERFAAQGDEARASLEAAPALALCRRLHASGRSADALGLARAVRDFAHRTNGGPLSRRAATACGLLLNDMGDVVGAIDHHADALRRALADEDRVEASRAWSNLGGAFVMSGSHGLAARCYHRSLAMVEAESGPVFSRYAALVNLSNSLYQVGEMAEGLVYARLALQESRRPLPELTGHDRLILIRNLVRLLAANARLAEAEPHVQEATALAVSIGTPRARIASATIRATYELAIGEHDLALTRLGQALDLSRGMHVIAQDTLGCVIRAEEAAGHPERALLRLRELSESHYRAGIDRARRHTELDRIAAGADGAPDPREEQERVRLSACIAPPSEPPEWKTLQRLGMGASLRREPSGRHGLRVAALTKALAIAHGAAPLEALETGLAAELHDIGMLSVPEGIARKRGPLNPVEQAIYLKHVDAGAEILCDDHHPRLLRAREIARYHHARWDGTGYPDRVGGRFIPLAARLCAVANGYDTLVHAEAPGGDRSMEAALARLQSEAGGAYDPELVGCFAQMIRSEASNHGLDTSSPEGSACFSELVTCLEEDRGFL